MRLKVAFIYPMSDSYFRPPLKIGLYYNFFLQGMRESDRIDYVPMRVDSPFDASHLSKFDVLIYWSCSGSVLDIINSGTAKQLKCVRGQDPPDMDKKWRQKYRDGKFKFMFFHGMKNAYPRFCKFPKNLNYESIMCGVDDRYFSLNLKYQNRKKEKILFVGSWGNKDTVLRHLMMDSSRVEIVHTEAGFVGNDFSKILVQYQAACVSMAHFTVPKYVELPIAGCLTFMGAGDTNGIEELGFVDGESCVYVMTKNYEQRFDEYLSTVDDPKWERIALAGRLHAQKVWGNKAQVDKFIDVLEKYA